MPAVWECSHVTVLGGNYTEILWWQTLPGHFRMTITTFQMLCNEISPLVSQVMPSHHAKSHDVFDAHGGIYSPNALPSPIIRLNTFSHETKTTSSERKNLFVNFEIWHFQTLNTSKCALKQGDGSIASGSIQKTVQKKQKNSWITNYISQYSEVCIQTWSHGCHIHKYHGTVTDDGFCRSHDNVNMEDVVCPQSKFFIKCNTYPDNMWILTQNHS